MLVDADFRDTVAWVPLYFTNVHRDGQVRSGLRVSSNFLPAKRGYQQTSVVTLEYKIRGNVNSAGSFFLATFSVILVQWGLGFALGVYRKSTRLQASKVRKVPGPMGSRFRAPGCKFRLQVFSGRVLVSFMFQV